MKRTLSAAWLLLIVCLSATAQRVNVITEKGAIPRQLYAAEFLQKKLTALGYEVVVTANGKRAKADYRVRFQLMPFDEIQQKDDKSWREEYRLSSQKKEQWISAYDGAGWIYGAVEYADLVRQTGNLRVKPATGKPGMVMRGTCIGLQKTEYLPGHTVYEYPYTPENFPWFYDKQQWVEYLDMMAENRFNSLYLWNGHPFASLVKLKDYPFALEVDEETFRKNEDMFSFLTTEADRRGICVIQMFYNIILSKPFADHYGLKTQDRNRPITPLISDYMRKSIAAFVEKYPNVGFLVCLGEAMATIDDDVAWMKETIIPGIKDGLAASGRTDTPPIVLRSHDTDGPLVLHESLPLYPNIYTMSKYTGESLTTYEPGGPWGETHRQLAAAAPVHIDNVHILANLEPWRWSSPAFTQKTVQAMHRVHHSTGLHLYPQASYWDWPYAADRLENGQRLRQLDRDWMWYRVWGRYSWDCERGEDDAYWTQTLAEYFGIDTLSAAHLLTAYNEAGEIAPKLLRRFGITEGNRQTLLLGMKVSQLVNPYKYTIYPGFYESCGPQGEKLIEYVEKECKHQPHVGELPLDIVDQCVAHGRKAMEEVNSITVQPTHHQEEFERVKSDFRCYRLFSLAFHSKVRAAEMILRYKWTKNLEYLDAAVPLLESSQRWWNDLCRITDNTYLYANSMQTSQRRIPVGGDNGKMKTWSELATVYQEELDALKDNISKLKNPVATDTKKVLKKATPAKVCLLSPATTVKLTKGAVLFENRADTRVDSIAPELEGLQAIVLNRDTTRIVGTTIEFEAATPVRMLVGFFQDDDPKWAKAPKLEIDATGNEYGQAEPVLTNAISMVQMPKVNIHQYILPAGHHTMRLPKGIIMVAGFTTTPLQPRDCGLNGAGDEVDWLLMR